ncbi:hypothetical protein ASPWEDRAFT_43988 [Aspergillus wentii DTO 134E9]|uniref:BTB domain-containing protein n=1 Tax=Aspergillus wentii DTO 134E9 TaxID=1073089 RepID=A0A1L9RAN5_ASPWE|nr:uncharacterized protein ASPWEDRAFT_43988 [Aspergillus wentii DTO 134E9]KAI9934569.1 hypothetical protein MW887_000184 [Aspergillus wentii]OJJ31985.1 hypothetical protein ASPWEDRAFT_43988 [Aspergillus wentii DTO 134E9]
MTSHSSKNGLNGDTAVTNGFHDDEIEYPYPQPSKSPYQTPIMTLFIGQKRDSYSIPENYLRQSPKLVLANGFWGKHLFLSDVDEDVGHTLLHYLYTGGYETIKPWPFMDVDLSKWELEYRRSALAYCAARTYQLDGLIAHAQHYMEKFASMISIFALLNIVTGVYPSLSEGEDWFLDHVKSRIAAAFAEDNTLFVQDSFLKTFGEVPAFDRFLMQSALDIYSEGVLRTRDSSISREETPEQSVPPSEPLYPDGPLPEDGPVQEPIPEEHPNGVLLTEPKLEPESEPELQPAPEPERVLEPIPEPALKQEPVQEPLPEALPAAAVEPEPIPEPAPAPASVSTHQPSLLKGDQSIPDLWSDQAPEPAPVPAAPKPAASKPVSNSKPAFKPPSKTPAPPSSTAPSTATSPPQPTSNGNGHSNGTSTPPANQNGGAGGGSSPSKKSKNKKKKSGLWKKSPKSGSSGVAN